MQPDIDRQEARRNAVALIDRARRKAEHEQAVALVLLTTLRRAWPGIAAEYGCTKAHLFGSLAWGGFDPDRSDIDLLVSGLPPTRLWDMADTLAEILGRPVHVVLAESAPPGLVERVVHEGEALA